jgi:hypothetical protein
MPVPGYDPDDLDAELEGLLSESEIQEHLSDEEFRQYKNGGSLINLLGEDDVHELLDEHGK